MSTGLALAERVPHSLLSALRRSRGFVVEEVLLAKLARLNRWFAAQGLDAAVVGLSGGVDSALVLGLLLAASRARGSALRKVVALLLPVAGAGATGQAEATELGRLAAAALGAEVWEAPLGPALASTIAALARSSGLAFDAWSEGQCASVMRTPALYGAAALLQAHGFRSVVVGTTNRDEGAYLGFFGKASDGMVDVQPISDLHKSEVRALARCLGVPSEIIERVPTGDVHDGRCDEQLIGASYDSIETVLRLLELGLDPSAAGAGASGAVQRQHARNRHKYAVGNPAIHLDVMPRGVPGGWSDQPFCARADQRPPAGVLLGEWEPPTILLDRLQGMPSFETLALPEGLALHVRELLTHADCERLIAAARASGQAEPVGVTGIQDSYGAGSARATAWSPALAAALWQKLEPAVPAVRFLGAHSPTDAFATRERAGHRSWRVVGLSPVLRFMCYEPGGQHFCHYDAGFDYGDGRRTLLSVVFYLSDMPVSGATRFVRDGQLEKPVAQRDFSDWARETREEEVLLAVRARRGDVLVFDHRLCHDVERWRGPGPRWIVRADVVYESIPDGRP